MSNSSARSQIFVNLGFMLMKSFFLLLSIRLADQLLAAGTMGLLLLFRRQGALWANFLQFGFSQSLQKFYISNPDSVARSNMWAVLTKWMVIAGMAAVLVSWLLGAQLSEALFGEPDQTLALAFGIYTAGLALGFIACSSWIAEFRLVHSNIIDWLNGSLLFVLCILAGSHLSGVDFSLLLAVLTLVASGLSLFLFMRRHKSEHSFLKNKWKIERTVIQYSMTRGMSAFVDMGTLVVGPWLLREKPEQAGFLIISYTVLRLAQTLIMPLAQVVALRANSYRHDQRQEERRVVWLGLISFACGWLAVAAYYIVGNFFLALWLPNSYVQVVLILNELIIFTPALCLFYSLRNYIELRYLLPWNLIVLTLALAGMLLGYYFSSCGGLTAVVLGSKIMFTLLMLSGVGFFWSFFLHFGKEK